MTAVDKLRAACRDSGAMLSVGLEPAPQYLRGGFDANVSGYEAYLRLIIDATVDVAAAYKFNLAFFEAMGSRGMALLERIRDTIPRDTFVIMDAKRGDIGSTAKMYAEALFEHLGADAVTVNPLMGRDSAVPFLEYTDRLTYFLVLTSNPGAADFLLADGLYRKIAAALTFWAEAGNAGFVIGATRGEEIAEVRGLAADVPFLVPGVGAQGGDLERVVKLGARQGSVGDPSVDPGLLFHVTRGVLPDVESTEDVGESIRARALAWRDRLQEVMGHGDTA